VAVQVMTSLRRRVVVACAAAITAALLSPVATGSVLPRALAAGPTYTFGFAGDSGATTAAGKLFDSVGNAGLTAFFHLGDMSYSQITPESAWCSFARSRTGMSVPFEIISGNHEDDGPDGAIGKYTSCLPDSLGAQGNYGQQYYVDYPATSPLVRFIMISPSLTFPPSSSWSYSKTSSHYAWTASTIDAARTTGIPWVVVGMHDYCLSLVNYPCASHPDLMNMLLRKKVDVYLQAHDHGYSRTKQLSLSSQCGAVTAQSFNPACVADANSSSQYIAGNGTVIATVGSGGRSLNSEQPASPQAPYFQSWMGSNANPTYGFLKLAVSASSLSAAFVGSSGGSFTDSFSITRDEAAPAPKPGPTPTPTTTPTATPTSTTGTVTRVPASDSWTGSDAPTVNHGSEASAYVDGSPAKTTYLKYDLSGVSGTVTSAVLRVTTVASSASGSPDHQSVHRVADSSWTEQGLTWNNQPAIDPVALGSVAGTTGSTSYDIALTPSGIASAIGGRLSLAIDSTGGDAFYITTRETSTPPRLVVTTR
jgi:hypothetical protein